MSHAIYYDQTHTMRPARRLRGVQCQAAGPSSGAGKPDRRERVRRKAAQIAESLDSLAVKGNLASYDLRLPSTSKAYTDDSSSSSSSSSDSSDSEADAAPSAKTTSFTSSAASPFRTATPPTTSKPSTLGTATISVCQGKACRKRGSDRVMAALQHSTGNVDSVQLTGCKCLGQCKKGPAVKVEMPSGQKIVYVNVNGAEVAVQLAGIVLQ
ncbi:hypothetical protein Ndes2437B_g02050 [Nannochloris sp. 'desiccata']